jgi:hypothetical protein
MSDIKTPREAFVDPVPSPSKTIPAPPNASNSKTPLDGPVDLQSFIKSMGSGGKAPPLSPPEPMGEKALLEKRYEFLRHKLRYEFMTPYDHPEHVMVKPRDMIAAFVEVTSAHGIPHINAARGR